MNYKVIKYRCGCKYIVITDKKKTVMPRSSYCPIHRVPQDYVILYCVDCGLRIKATPKAGHNQARCYPCAEEQKKKRNRELWETRYRGRYKQNGKTQYTKKETAKDEAKRQINAWYESCRAIFAPVWEGVV